MNATGRSPRTARSTLVHGSLVRAGQQILPGVTATKHKAWEPPIQPRSKPTQKSNRTRHFLHTRLSLPTNNPRSFCSPMLFATIAIGDKGHIVHPPNHSYNFATEQNFIHRKPRYIKLFYSGFFRRKESDSGNPKKKKKKNGYLRKLSQ